MEAQLRHSRISKNEVTCINHPNRDEPPPKDICSNPTVTLGQLAVT
jgi:hypothetical protein